MGSKNYLSDLNSQQRKAVVHGLNPAKKPRALLIVAGPGSGKTKTLSNRAAHLIVQGGDPTRIALLSFTNASARELTNRCQGIVAQATGLQNVQLPWAGTFHSVAVRLLRSYGRSIGVKANFTIKDRSDSATC